ncbi:MAG: TolC family protein [Desulfarculus sp.]|nr:TolC family protein [Desulfarculus sp.]
MWLLLALAAGPAMAGQPGPPPAQQTPPMENETLLRPVVLPGADRKPRLPSRPDAPTRLTLAEAINRALVANRNLANSQDNLESARLGIVVAESDFELKIYPQAGVSFNAANSDDGASTYALGFKLEKKISYGTRASVAPVVSLSGDTYKSGLDMRLTQPLFRGTSPEFNLSSLHGAQYYDRTARRSFYLNQVSTVVETVAGVYEVIRQRELLRLNEDAARRLNGFTQAAMAKEKAGLATPIDVFRASIQLKQAEDSLTNARESFQDAADNLKVLLALRQEESILLEAPLSYQSLRLAEDKAVELALERRVELEQASDAVSETQRLSRVAKHGTLPELNLSLGYQRFSTGDNINDSFLFDRDSRGLSLVTSSDLNRSAENANFQRSLLNVQAATRNREDRRDDVIRQVRRELRSLRRGQERIANQQEQIRQAEGQLELAQVKFQHGLTDNFTLLEAENRLRQAQTTLLSLVVDYIVGTYRLRAALGTLVERGGPPLPKEVENSAMVRP